MREDDCSNAVARRESGIWATRRSARERMDFVGMQDTGALDGRGRQMT